MTVEPESAGPEEKPRRRRPPKPPRAARGAFPGQRVTTRTETESLPIESPEEIASRLRREEAREAHELFKEKTILIALLVATAFVLITSSYLLVLSDKMNLQSGAPAALTSTLAGYFGWFSGKQAK